MLTPSIFGRNFVDDFFNDPFDDMFRDMFRTSYERTNTNGLMSTDVQDLGDHYQMEMELPGYQKEDLKADLKDGYLMISAQHKEENDTKDENGKFVRRERYTGNCSRRKQSRQWKKQNASQLKDNQTGKRVGGTAVQPALFHIIGKNLRNIQGGDNNGTKKRLLRDFGNQPECRCLRNKKSIPEAGKKIPSRHQLQ